MGGDLHVGAEPQEVAPVGLLVLVAVRDDADAAHWQHSLERTEWLRPTPDGTSHASACSHRTHPMRPLQLGAELLLPEAVPGHTAPLGCLPHGPDSHPAIWHAGLVPPLALRY